MFKKFRSCSIILNVVTYLWLSWNMQNYKVKHAFWPCSKIFDQVQKILTKVKKFWTWSKYFWTSKRNRYQLRTWRSHFSSNPREFAPHWQFLCPLHCLCKQEACIGFCDGQNNPPNFAQKCPGLCHPQWQCNVQATGKNLENHN